nr:restriction endonuclease subunit S [Falsirhodobacter halotolerans]
MKEANLLSLSYGNIVRKDINTPSGLLPESFETYQIVEPDDVVFRLTDLQNDKRSLRSAICLERGIITSAYLAVQSDGVLPAFMNYLMRAYDVQKIFYSMGGGLRQSLGFEDLRRMSIVAPSVEEQTAIARFLDRETSRIDGLLEKKGRFIELLKEKRAALITHAVTKGIDAGVPMKDSTIDWIGEVPEHWMVTKLGYLGRSANGINIGGEAFGSGYPFISYGDVYKNRQLPEKIEGLVQSSKADRVTYSVKAGDILFTRTSETVDEVAFPSVAMSTITGAVFAGFLIRFRPYAKALSPLFSKYAFQNSGLRDFFAREMKIVTRASLSQGILQSMPIVLPPLAEQEKIAAHLEEMSIKFDTLISKTHRSIELLKEKRSALISAAVTGKIDVRNAA